MSAFGNIGYLSSLGMLPVFIVTNLALPVFIRRQYPKEFSLVLHGLSPVVSILIFAAAIWLSINPWPSPPINSFPWVVVAVDRSGRHLGRGAEESKLAHVQASRRRPVHGRATRRRICGMLPSTAGPDGPLS